MFVDHLREVAERNPACPAMVSRDRQLSYGELIARVDRSAAGLADRGLAATDVVGLAVKDEIEHLVACLSLLDVGATQVTLSTFDSQEANLSLARAAGVTAVLCDDLSLVPADLKRLRWSEVRADQNGRARASRGPGRILLRTSGTTGVGKIVVCDESQLALQARHVAQYGGQRYMRAASVEHNNSKRHRLYCLFAEGTNVFRPMAGSDLAHVCEAFGVSLLDISLMHAEDLIRREVGTHFRNITIQTAGSALPYRMRRLLQERVSPHLYVRYGATECGTIAVAGPSQHDEDEVVGFPVAGVEVRISDERGGDVPVAASGRIGIRTPGTATGYLNSPAETAKRFVDGWFYPGDIGRFRADGCLIVEGRSDDMMILNGLNVFPQEIERVLQLHPAVRAAAAIALASPVHGQIPVAAVELETGRSVEVSVLMDFARERLGLRAPRRIVILEALPRAGEGKILRRTIASMMIEPVR